jgi:arginyl-tRNA--protein-N-Asp/Glu arginylyltransferase
MKTETNILTATVDALGLLQAQIAELKQKEAAMRAEIEAAGLRTIEGNLYRVTISHCDGRATIDWRTIAQKFEPSRQLITAHTTIGNEYTKLTITARKGA